MITDLARNRPDGDSRVRFEACLFLRTGCSGQVLVDLTGGVLETRMAAVNREPPDAAHFDRAAIHTLTTPVCGI